MGLGYVKGVTHDYVRHGHHHAVCRARLRLRDNLHRMQTTSPPSGVSGLRQAHDEAVPETLTVHLIVDNYATHKHAKVRIWLAQRPRFQSTTAQPTHPGSTRSS